MQYGMEQPFDESFFMYREDCDLGMRLNIQGYRILAVPGASLQHYQDNSLQSRKKSNVQGTFGHPQWVAYLLEEHVSLGVPPVRAGPMHRVLSEPLGIPRVVTAKTDSRGRAYDVEHDMPAADNVAVFGSSG